MSYWMISNRAVTGKGKDRVLGPDKGSLTFWGASGLADLTKLDSWAPLTAKAFRESLITEAKAFPDLDDPARQEEQQHITLFIHGFNNSWQDTVQRYQQIADDLYGGTKSLGVCVLFTWPSDGMKVAYYPDRLDARRTANDLAEVLTTLYDYMTLQQNETMRLGHTTCKAKISIIAHSMGNFVLQKGLQTVWTRRNQPLLVSLLNQVLMVAADVDNDLFKGGEGVDKSDGDAMANLSYRITALYSGLDAVLGVSAGLKHFGKRRLGRTGLDPNEQPPDNVWDIDCSKYLTNLARGMPNTHSAYFEVKKIQALMRDLLRGIDRKVVLDRNELP
jgi:esterase/lipase superfamily enzyme